MSDYNPFVGEGEPAPVDAGPEDFGAADDTEQPTEQPAPEAPPREYLDVDEVGDRYVTITVDGQPEEVPIKEALQGYSRTSDYTRKTQALAQQRQEAEYALAVQRALQAQPDETLRLLARQHGVNFEQQSPPPQREWEQPSYDEGRYDVDDDPYADPVTKQLRETQRRIEAMEHRDQERAAEQTLRAAVGGLQQKYQLDDSTIREVVGSALQAGLGPGAFEMIYKNIAFDRAQQAREQVKAQRVQTDAQREQSKVRSQQLVASGGSAAAAGSPMPQGAPDGRMSIQDAFELAWKEHGGA